jgi:hypothetical protein
MQKDEKATCWVRGEFLVVSIDLLYERLGRVMGCDLHQNLATNIERWVRLNLVSITVEDQKLQTALVDIPVFEGYSGTYRKRLREVDIVLIE